MGGTTLGMTIAAVACAAVGIGALWWFSRERLDGIAVLRAIGCSCGAGLVALFALVATGLEDWGFTHVVYLGLTVSIPLFGLAAVVVSLVRPHPGWVRPAAGVLLVPAVLGFYATHIEPYRLQVDHVDVAVDPARDGRRPVRIAVLADLQTNRIGSFERRVVDRLMAQEPDVILVPGDLFQSGRREFSDALPELRRLLRRLRAPGGVYAVHGDVDGLDRVDIAFDGHPDARVLNDEVVTVEVGDRTLRIGGTRLAYDAAGARQVKEELQADPDDGSIRILLSHRPDTVYGLERSSRVDLTVAGHTHGGQIVIPFFGPLVTMTGVPRDVARGGLHEVEGNRIYVSPGIGMERNQAPQVRLNDPPTIGVLELGDPEGAGA